MPAPDIVTPSENDADFVKLAKTRSRIAIALSVAMITMYFTFMALFAFAKPTMGMILVPGLSLCMLLGAGIIVGSFVLCLVYIVWTNCIYDPAVRRVSH